MTEKKYDQLLRDFLEADAAQRAEGVTLTSLHRSMQKLGDRFLTYEERLDRYGRRLRRLENETQRLSLNDEGPDWKPDPREITGTHDLAVLKKEHDEMRDDQKWSRRQRWIVVGTIAAALTVACISGCVTYAVTSVGVRAPGGK